MLLIVEEYLVISLSVLINVAFLTLLERKLLGLSQVRVGPNKVGAWGALQPAADAVKLFTKSLTQLSPMNKSLYFLSPVMGLSLMMLFLMLISAAPGGVAVLSGLLMFLMLLSLNVYPLLGAGWGANSKYALLGGLRAVAQTISYEISLSFLALALFWGWGGVCFLSSSAPSPVVSPLLVSGPLFLFWVTTCIAELNRTPFDFAEGESELVSGFNVEYGAVGFALIFMAEYGMIYFLSVLTAGLFLVSGKSSAHCLLMGVVLAASSVWLRVTLPRFRYDLLMDLTWKQILPWALGLCQVAGAISLSGMS